MNAFTKNAITKQIVVLLLSVPTILFFSSFTRVDDGPKKLKVGKVMPSQNTTLISTDGDTTTLVDQIGENGLLVVFSCNTCPFVVGSDNFPGWERQYNEIDQLAAQNNINFVLVNSNEAKREGVDSIDEMKKRATDKGYTMPYLMDIDHIVADAFGARTTPHVYLFDSEKKLIYTGSIDNTWDSDRTEDISYLANAIELHGQGDKVKEKTTQPRGCSIKRTTK